MNAVGGLDARLSAVADMVRPGARGADVGGEHALRVCTLAKSGVIPSGLACDAREKPLLRAAATVARLGLAERVSCRLGDGLRAFSCNEADDVVIAGMGGEVIAKILEDRPPGEWEEKNFILQPVLRAPELRRWLFTNGFELVRERAVRCAGRVYVVICARFTGRRQNVLPTDPACYLGRLPGDCPQAAKAHIQARIRVLAERARGLKKTDAHRARELDDLIHTLSETIEGWGRFGA
jgi:tRNA (adenine22-N1)-methyltransferase